MVMLGLSRVYAMLHKTNNSIKNITHMQMDVKHVHSILRKPLSVAGYNLADTQRGLEINNPGQADELSVRFVDKFGDYGCAGSEVIIEFYHTNNKLYQRVTCPSAERVLPLFPNVADLRFTLLNQAGAAVIPGDSIKTVEYYIVLEDGNDYIGSSSREITGRVSPLNM